MASQKVSEINIVELKKAIHSINSTNGRKVIIEHLSMCSNPEEMIKFLWREIFGLSENYRLRKESNGITKKIVNEDVDEDDDTNEDEDDDEEEGHDEEDIYSIKDLGPGYSVLTKSKLEKLDKLINNNDFKQDYLTKKFNISKSLITTRKRWLKENNRITA